MAPRDGTDGKLVTISGGRQHAQSSELRQVEQRSLLNGNL